MRELNIAGSNSPAGAMLDPFVGHMIRIYSITGRLLFINAVYSPAFRLFLLIKYP